MTVEVNAAAAQDATKADAAANETVLASGSNEAAAATEAKPTETKDAAAKQPVVPEKYDLKLPEGSTLDAKHLEALAAYSKEKGLTNEQAQAVLDRENQAVSAFVQKQQQELKQKPEAWLAEAKADKEIGGESFSENAELGKRVIAKFGSDTLKKILNETGLGNHPELVRFAVRLGKAMSEDTLVLPGTQAGGQRSIEDVFYPKASE